MEPVYLVGYFTPQIKRYFKGFFNRFGLSVHFAKEDPGQGKIVFFKSNMVKFQSGKKSMYGIAFPETKTALIKYPWPTDIKVRCLNFKGTTEPLRLFSLVALHEYLHLKGLAHCRNSGCLMAKLDCNANGTGGYCLPCLSLLKDPAPLCSHCKEKANLFLTL